MMVSCENQSLQESTGVTGPALLPANTPLLNFSPNLSSFSASPSPPFSTFFISLSLFQSQTFWIFLLKLTHSHSLSYHHHHQLLFGISLFLFYFPLLVSGEWNFWCCMRILWYEFLPFCFDRLVRVLDRRGHGFTTRGLIASLSRN